MISATLHVNLQMYLTNLASLLPSSGSLQKLEDVLNLRTLVFVYNLISLQSDDA